MAHRSMPNDAIENLSEGTSLFKIKNAIGQPTADAAANTHASSGKLPPLERKNTIPPVLIAREIEATRLERSYRPTPAM